MKLQHYFFILFFLLISGMQSLQLGGHAFAQYSGGGSAGHAMVVKTDIKTCTASPVYVNVGIGGPSDSRSMVAKTDIQTCPPLPLYENISKGGSSNGYALAKDTACKNINTCSVIALVIPDTTICKGSTVTLFASGGSSYKWLTGNSADTMESITVTPDTSTAYTVNVSNGSCFNPATVTIKVNSYPTAVISGPTTLCKTGSITLIASGASGYLWNTGATTDSIMINSFVDSLYSVIASNGKCSDTSSVTIQQFVADPIAGTNIICTGDSSTLIASAQGATNFLWNTGQTSATITVAPATDSIYSVTISNGACTDSASVVIKVSSPPIASITGNTSFCSETGTILTASGGIRYLWNTADTVPVLIIKPKVETSYIVTAYIGSCSDTESVKVTIKPSPVITTSDVSITEGTSATITATATGNSTYTWASSPDLSCIACQSPVATPVENTTYYITAMDSNGCISIDSVMVTLLVETQSNCIYVPNAFSPNMDGQNDLLKVHGDCISELSFAIYDRWGEKVFETTDITKGWDGTYKGKKMNSGVFVYYLTGTLRNGRGPVTKKGNISLIR